LFRIDGANAAEVTRKVKFHQAQPGELTTNALLNSIKRPLRSTFKLWRISGSS